MSLMRGLVLIGLLFSLVVLFGCCASSAPSSKTSPTTGGQGAASGAQTSQSAGTQNTVATEEVNTLPPNVLVNKNLTTLLLSRSDLYSYWNVKDSWDNYKYMPDIKLPNPGAGITCITPARDCPTLEIEKTDERPYIVLTITIWDTNTTDDAIQMFASQKSDLARGLSEKMPDVFLGGNERVSAATLPDKHRTWGAYTVLFRRNNVIVSERLQSQPLQDQNAIINEAVAYAKIIDKKIQES